MEITKEQREQLRKAWVDALRSGKYRQGVGMLCEHEMYCCLGVACEVFVNAFPEAIEVAKECSAKVYDGKDCELPDTVAMAFGIESAVGTFNRTSLIEINDDGEHSFSQIATIIESKPPGLFVEGT